MKKFAKFLILIFIIVAIAIAFNYKKLNVLAGYSAKSMTSSVFLAKRDFHFTDTTDTNFSPIKYVKNILNKSEKSITGSVYGLLKRKAAYREGLGSVLLTKGKEFEFDDVKPKRTRVHDSLIFPYGNRMHKDTVFSNINYKDLNIAIDSMFKDAYKTRAVVVIQKDKIIAERYSKGIDENSLLLGWSMTKSIVSTLYGVLEHQGKISVNDKAPIEEWANDERKNITLNNLLQMNSGLAWGEIYDQISDVTKMLYLHEDMSRSQLEKPLKGKPNESWHYSSGVSNLLSGIVRKQFSTYQEYLDFWYTDLIDKIGMNSMVIEADLSGNYIASSYGWATARDWSKLGLLYLHEGNWNGEQVFSKDWANYATTATPTSNGHYGAGIWLNNFQEFPDLAKNAYYFKGFQGQYVFVLPDQEMIIVRLGLVKDKKAVNSFVSGVMKSIKN